GPGRLADKPAGPAQNDFGRPPSDWASRPQSDYWPRFTPNPPPSPQIPRHGLWLLLLFLLACLLLRLLARLRGNAMTLRLFPLFRRRSERKEDASPARSGAQSEVPTGESAALPSA